VRRNEPSRLILKSDIRPRGLRKSIPRHLLKPRNFFEKSKMRNFKKKLKFILIRCQNERSLLLKRLRSLLKWLLYM